MSAKSIKGITVKIGGDTMGLSKALKEVEKQSSGLSSNLKAVNKALKLDPSNTVLLAEKQKILAESVDATKEKLETLKSVQDQIQQQYAAGDIDRGAYLDFQKELAYTEDNLKRLEKQQREFGSTVLKTMEAAGKKVTDFGNKVSSAGEKISDVGEKFLPVTAAITAAGTAAVMAGSDLIESQNKVEVAFGDASARVEAFAETTLDAYGIAKNTSLDMAALYGDMATSMEIPRDAAAEMSVTLVGLAGDLASFKNLELEEASNALRGIFTGETESLKNLGIVMTQDNLLRFAMQQGMLDTAKSAQQLAKEQLALEKAQVAYTKAVKKHGEGSIEAREAALKMAAAEEALSASAKASLDSLTEAEKVQLRYAYVLNATQNAQGDFARTSDNAANSMRTASEACKELAADFGALMAPYVAEVAQAISALIKGFIALPEETKKTILVIAALIAVIGPLLTIGGKLISGIGNIISIVGKLPAMVSAAGAAFSAMGATLSSALPVIAIVAGIGVIIGCLIYLMNHSEELAALWNEKMESIRASWEATKTNIQNGITSWVTGVKEGFASMISSVQSFCSNALNRITNWGASMKAKATTVIDNVRNAISSGLERIRNLFNFDWNLPHIKLPHFNISGSFSLNPPRVPTFGVQWFAKGAILDGAQLFGTLGGKWLGGGEAGREAVLPLSGFYSELRSILGSFLRSPGESFDMTGLFRRLDWIYERLGRLQVMLDTGTLVGEIVDPLDSALAAKQRLAERGV